MTSPEFDKDDQPTDALEFSAFFELAIRTLREGGAIDAPEAAALVDEYVRRYGRPLHRGGES